MDSAYANNHCYVPISLEFYKPYSKFSLINISWIGQEAIASATQDITVDALRIEQIRENEGKSMAAGAAIAVVGWWTVTNWEELLPYLLLSYLKILVLQIIGSNLFSLGILIILMNIGLLFVHEPIETDRQKIKETDRLIEEKLGSRNMITNFIAYITGI